MSGIAKQAAWLAESGIAVPAWRIVLTAEEARAAACELRYPLVVKPVPESAAHKTEQGLVYLRLREPADLDRAVADLQAKLPEAPILVQEMIDDVVEVLLAVREDPDFGPIAAIGSGGVMVELLDDVAYLSLPASSEEFRVALRRLRVSRLLAGFRGQASRDVDALVRAASRLGDAYLAARPLIAEFEINPLGVRPEGTGVVALDTLEVLRSAGGGATLDKLR
jgi:acetate---CoA ligase (ADP-forming)